MNSYHRATIWGLVLAMPFVAMNFMVANGVDWFVTVLRPEGSTSLLEQVLLFASLVLMLAGGVVALGPVLKASQKKILALNVFVGVGLILAAIVVGYSLAEEMYRCDVQDTQNCD